MEGPSAGKVIQGPQSKMSISKESIFQFQLFSPRKILKHGQSGTYGQHRMSLKCCSVFFTPRNQVCFGLDLFASF